jgi:hypothetical protein
VASPKGFFASLFDFAFAELVTPRIIRVIFITGLVFIALASFWWLSLDPAVPIGFGLIFSVCFFLIGAVGLRIWLEVIMVLFRIAEDLRAIRALGQPPGDTRS